MWILHTQENLKTGIRPPSEMDDYYSSPDCPQLHSPRPVKHSSRIVAAIEMLENHFANLALASPDESPVIPEKSARRQRPSLTPSPARSYVTDDEGYFSSMNRSPKLASPTTSSAFRDAIWSTSIEGLRHNKHASISSSRSSSEINSDNGSSFEFDGLDDSILALIEKTSHRNRHTLAAQTYKMSREQRKQQRLQKHAELQIVWL